MSKRLNGDFGTVLVTNSLSFPQPAVAGYVIRRLIPVGNSGANINSATLTESQAPNANLNGLSVPLGVEIPTSLSALSLTSGAAIGVLGPKL